MNSNLLSQSKNSTETNQSMNVSFFQKQKEMKQSSLKEIKENFEKEIIKKPLIQEKTKQNQLSQLNKAFARLQKDFDEHKSQTLIQNMILKDLSKINKIAQLTKYKPNYEQHENNFVKTFMEERENVPDVLNYIPTLQPEELQQLNDKQIINIIQKKPEIQIKNQQVEVYGVQFENNKFVKMSDLLNTIDDKVLEEHLVQVVQQIIDQNNFSTKYSPDISKILTFINGEFITNSKEDSVRQIVQRYIRLLRQEGDFYEGIKNIREKFTFTQLVYHKMGECYVEDKVFEKSMGESVIFVRNTDKNCLYAALFIALVHKSKKGENYILHNKHFTEQFNKNIFNTGLLSKYEKNNKKNLYFYTMKMIDILGVHTDETELITKFTEEFNIDVKIMDFLQPKQCLPESPNQIVLMYKQNHYHYIKNFLQTVSHITKNYNTKYCFTHQNFHLESSTCKKCTDATFCSFCNKYHVSSKIFEPYQCETCHKSFMCQPTAQCLENHKKVCEQFKFCSYCNKIHYQLNKCQSQIDYELKHFRKGKLLDKKQPFMVFDIESILQSCPDNKKYTAEHIPFLICYQIVSVNPKTKEYELENLFHDNHLSNLQPSNTIISKDPFKEFIEIIFTAQQKHNIQYIYSHNGSKYDNNLFLSYIINQNVNLRYDTVYNNGRLLQLTLFTPHGDILIKDSLLLLNIPLSKFNKDYKLKDICKRYNFTEAVKYEQSYTFLTTNMFEQYLQNGGKSATISFYNQNGGLTQKYFHDGVFQTMYQYEDFVKEQKNIYGDEHVCVDYQTYNQNEWNAYLKLNGDKDFVNQYIVYCQQDVSILTLGLIKMSELTLQHEKVNMLNYLTISSLAYNLYLANSGDNKFQQQPEDFNFNRSKCEQKLLESLQDIQNLSKVNQLFKTNFTQIEVIGTNVKYGKYNIDIIIQTNLGKYLVEVNGVFYHGLIQLKESDDYYTLMQQRRQHHDIKQTFIQQTMTKKGFAGLINITDKEIDLMFPKTKINPKYDITNRDVFKGGRTEYYYNYYKWDNEKRVLKGTDLTSLYPSMMLQNLPLRDCIIGKDLDYVKQLTKYAKSITGTAEEKLIAFINGCDKQKRLIQVKCSILPPQGLYNPVLCVKINNKLLSPLCRTCAELKCKDVEHSLPCNHNETERLLYGFFDEIELIHAINSGYEIKEIYETHLYQITSFNDPTFKGNDFIKKQMFMKTLYSSPSDYNIDVLTQLQQDEIISDFKIKGENIFIQQTKDKEFQQVESNSALKNLYKLFMNSTYGKTGQNKIRSTHQIGNYDFLLHTFDELQHKNLHVEIINENSVIYAYETDSELQQLNQASSNPSLAGRITALSRTVLYQLQSHVQEKYNGIVLYSDTDSVYALLPKQYESLKGFTLKGTFGIKTEEKLQNTFEFCCIAPKQYAYQNKEKNYCTNKGISLCSDKSVELAESGEHIQLFEVYKNLVLGTKTQYTIKQNKNFEKDPKTLKIYCMPMEKTISMNERKRISQPLEKKDDFEYIDSKPF